MGGSASVVAKKYKTELEKPADASDVSGDLEKATAEVVRLRSLLNEALTVTLADGTKAVNSWVPARDVLEFESGGEITTSFIVLHGHCQSGLVAMKGNGADPAFQCIADERFAGFEPWFTGKEGVRLVCPTSPATREASQVAALQGLGGALNPKILEVCDGKPTHSWIDDGAWDLLYKDLEEGNVDKWYNTPDSRACITFIHDLIRKEINRGTKPERIFVCGHSLGGMMVSRAVPTFPDAALGGAILLNSAWLNQAAAADAAPAQKSLKVLAIAGKDDGVLSFDMAKASVKVLEDGALGEFTFREQNSEDQNPKLWNHDFPSPADKEAITTFIGLSA